MEIRTIVPLIFKPHIFTDYPQSNKKIFEEWFSEQDLPLLNREYLDIFWTSYLVNNNYGEDVDSLHKLQLFVDSLPRNKKYYTVFQFDNGCCVDFKDLDIVTFGMSWRLNSQKPTYVIPLVGEPYKKICTQKKYKANFVGNITHPIRKEIVDSLINIDRY